MRLYVLEFVAQLTHFNRYISKWTNQIFQYFAVDLNIFTKVTRNL